MTDHHKAILEITRELRIRKSRERCEANLLSFLKEGWDVIEPAQAFIPNWHIELICHELEKVASLQTKILLITIPPGAMKSLMCSVAFPSWVWTTRPEARFMCASYGADVVMRDAEKQQRVIRSQWFQDRWNLPLIRQAVDNFANDKTGVRISTSVGGMGTGADANFIIIDDPLKASEAMSKLRRQEVLDWWSNTAITRLRPPESGGIIVIMQRLHKDDLAGYLLQRDRGKGFVHLCLPQRYEESHPFPCKYDIRKTDGELLWPQMWSAEKLADIERDMAPIVRAGQMQQRPSEPGGNILHEEDWQPWTNPIPLGITILSVDTAMSQGETAAYSAITVWRIFQNENEEDRIILLFAWRHRPQFQALCLQIEKLRKHWNADRVLIEAKANGLSVIQELRRRNPEVMIEPINPGRVDKVARAVAVSSLFEQGYVYGRAVEIKPDEEGYLEGDDNVHWMNSVSLTVEACTEFPRGDGADLVDTVTQALSYIRTNMAPEFVVDHAKKFKEMRARSGARALY